MMAGCRALAMQLCVCSAVCLHGIQIHTLIACTPCWNCLSATTSRARSRSASLPACGCAIDALLPAPAASEGPASAILCDSAGINGTLSVAGEK